LKKPTGSVRFRFYKHENRTEPKLKKTGKKPSQTEAKPKKLSQTEKIEPKPVGLNRFWFFFKFSLIIFFLIKTEPN
jgi:hypothetical protein